MNRFAELLKKHDFPLFLAPMEEITDSAFRRICKTFGANFVVSEFVASEALIREVEKSYQKMQFQEEERPFGIQIFGHDEQSLVKAAQVAESKKPDFIDINWGCPVKKVVNKGAGSAILKDIPKMVAITKAVVNAVNLPVTVKTRLGWDMTDKPIVEIAEKLQDIGIQGITIHGRTRSQLYSGIADWTLIGEVKANPKISIPIIGNGDIDSPKKAMLYKQRYGVDAIMIGRAAIGNPWIFQHCSRFNLQGETTINSEPTISERIAICLQHLKDSAIIKGERKAVLEIRRHYAGYFRNISHFKPVRLALMNAVTAAEVEEILTNYS